MTSHLRLLAAALATFSAVAPAGAQMATQQNPPIRIDQCFITSKKLSKNASGTQIDYTNMGQRTYHKITFAVGYRNSAGNYLRRVIDQGTFTPGVQVQHHFSLYSDITYAGKETHGCKAIAAS
jgi:hypothetical protein